MPLFGHRMVVGNYKHARDYQAEVDKREKILAEWELEQRERWDRIHQLNENTKVR